MLFLSLLLREITNIFMILCISNCSMCERLLHLIAFSYFCYERYIKPHIFLAVRSRCFTSKNINISKLLLVSLFSWGFCYYFSWLLVSFLLNFNIWMESCSTLLFWITVFLLLHKQHTYLVSKWFKEIPVQKRAKFFHEAPFSFHRAHLFLLLLVVTFISTLIIYFHLNLLLYRLQAIGNRKSLLQEMTGFAWVILTSPHFLTSSFYCQY